MAALTIISKGVEHRVLYDQEDHELISGFNWFLHPDGYVFTKVNGRIIYIHRLIMGVLNNPAVEVDHRYHDKLDNQKVHLRICSPSQNRQNSRKVSGCTSVFKGIYLENDRFHAQITINKRVKNLGRFRSEKTAALAYDEAARSAFGEFAWLNFPGNNVPKQQTINGFL
jgi:hypothetical protein